MNIDEMKKMFDLDDIVNKVLDADETPEFARKCQKLAINKVESYTARITIQFGIEQQKMVETQSVDLFDSMFDINCIYFKKGMAAGAVLLLQMLKF